MSRGATVGVGAGALVLAGGAASATYIALKPASDLRSVNCYTAPSLDTSQGTRVMIGSKTTAEQQSAGQTNATPVDINDPVGLCSDLWRQGVLTKGATGPGEPIAQGAESRRVPQLTACTMREGIAGVFPGDEDVCKQLNLPNLG